MRKGFFAICSILLVLVISIAVLIPGCEGEGGQGTVNVVATICGVPYQGTVGYTLTGPGSPIQGTSVPATHSVDSGSWTSGNVSGGPANAFLDNIAPSATQTVSDGGNITFTLEFEENQDAAIEWVTWTRNGIPWQGSEMAVGPCNIVDVHFKQWVNGCEGYQVAVNETSRLKITLNGGPAVQIFVVNDWCAVNKTPEPIEKVSQVTSINGDPVEPGMNITLVLFEPVVLDVETIWTLVKETDYTKSINWFGVSVGVPEPGHDCVLFELVVPDPGVFTFTLDAEAEVAIDDVDANTDNNKTVPSHLLLTVSGP